MALDPALIALVATARTSAIEELDALAKPLKAALGPDVHFVKRGVYFRGKIVEVTAQVADRTFRAKLIGSSTAYSHGAAVNGVAMSLTTCTRDEWYEDLQRALTAIA